MRHRATVTLGYEAAGFAVRRTRSTLEHCRTTMVAVSNKTQPPLQYGVAKPASAHPEGSHSPGRDWSHLVQRREEPQLAMLIYRFRLSHVPFACPYRLVGANQRQIEYLLRRTYTFQHYYRSGPEMSNDESREFNRTVAICSCELPCKSSVYHWFSLMLYIDYRPSAPQTSLFLFLQFGTRARRKK